MLQGSPGAYAVTHACGNGETHHAPAMSRETEVFQPRTRKQLNGWGPHLLSPLRWHCSDVSTVG